MLNLGGHGVQNVGEGAFFYLPKREGDGGVTDAGNGGEEKGGLNFFEIKQ